MNKKLFTKADEQTIDIVSHAAEELRGLGAEIVDPGPEGDLLSGCLHKYVAQDDNILLVKRFPNLFPVDKDGKPTTDQIAKLLDLKFDPSQIPADVTLRDFGNTAAEGQSKYMVDLYLRQRGDANIKSNADLITKSNFHQDPHFPDRKKARENVEKATQFNMAERMLRRFSIQQMLLQCMAEQKLDALVYPTSSLPPTKLGAPAGPPINGRSSVWSFIGQQGFAVITVPAGFTTEVYDLVRDPSAPLTPAEAFGTGYAGSERTAGDDHTRLVGPIPAKLPIGMDIVGRPFDEPLLLKIASAYTASTKHRVPPPEFGPVAGEP
jgi:amidase